ncbi:chromatin modification- protein VID21 [Gonapodya sp. JEL0774]|nr:chromatin modification- protein VID21 [Gonapodya sp. JEL0774]
MPDLTNKEGPTSTSKDAPSDNMEVDVQVAVVHSRPSPEEPVGPFPLERSPLKDIVSSMEHATGPALVAPKVAEEPQHPLLTEQSADQHPTTTTSAPAQSSVLVPTKDVLPLHSFAPSPQSSLQHGPPLNTRISDSSSRLPSTSSAIVYSSTTSLITRAANSSGGPVTPHNTVASTPKPKAQDPHVWKARVEAAPAGKKFLSTTLQLAREEYKHRRVLDRVDELRAAGMWSLRQLKKHREPARRKAHRDFLLEEMKWMQQDFKQERRWKIAAAYTLSRAVLEFHSAPVSKSRVTVFGWVQRPSRYGKPRAISVQVGHDPSILDQVAGNAHLLPGNSADDGVSVSTFHDSLVASDLQRGTGSAGSELKHDQRVPEDGRPMIPFRGGWKGKGGPYSGTVNPRLLLPTDLEPAARVLPASSSILTYSAHGHSVPEIGALAPPNPEDSSPRLDPVDTAVVPVSRYMTRKTRYVEMRWDKSGKESKDFKEPPVKALQGDLKYDNALPAGRE